MSESTLILASTIYQLPSFAVITFWLQAASLLCLHMLSLMTVILAFISTFYKFANHVLYHIRDFGQIWHHLSLSSAKTISVSLINS